LHWTIYPRPNLQPSPPVHVFRLDEGRATEAQVLPGSPPQVLRSATAVLSVLSVDRSTGCWTAPRTRAGSATSIRPSRLARRTCQPR
jgi:hypothetical protein